MIDFAAATDRSTPGFERQRVGDWVLRSSAGATGRANSATLVGDPGAPIREALDRVDAWYADGGRATRAMVWADTEPAVVEELSRRGFGRSRPTVVMAAPLERVRAQLTVSDRLRARVEHQAPGVLRELLDGERLAENSSTDLPKTFAVASDHQDDLGAGLGVADGSLVGLFAMRTREDRQGGGAGSSVIDALLAVAQERGCETVWLQVESGNERAHGWYSRLGLETVSHYEYWVGPPQEQATSRQ